MTSTHVLAASLLRRSSRAYAAASLEQLYRTQPEWATTRLPATFVDPLADTEVRLLHLAESVAVDRPMLLQHSIAWYKVAFHHRQVPAEYLPGNVDAIRAALLAEMPPEAAAVVSRHLALARRHCDEAPLEQPTVLSRTAPHGEVAARFLLAILEGEGDTAVDLLREQLARGVPIADLHDHVLTPAQCEAGRMWLMGEIPIADEHYGSAIVDRCLWLLQDRLPRPAARAPRVLTMGVSGNLHDFGLRLVGQRMQLAGYAVHHLGSNMPASDLEWMLQDRAFDLVAISAVLTLHLGALAATVAQIRQATRARDPGRPGPRILVGGPPFGLVPDLFDVVGADAGAADAESAVAAALRLVPVPAGR